MLKCQWIDWEYVIFILKFNQIVVLNSLTESLIKPETRNYGL